MEGKNRIDQFAKATNSMVAANDQAYLGQWSIGRNHRVNLKSYSREEVEKIIKEGSLDQQLALSRNYFEKDSLYRRIILYYATLLQYSGIVIPNPSYGKSLSTEHIQKKYFQAVDYVEQMNLPTILTQITTKVLIDGCYYGIIKKLDKNSFTIMDLPAPYCVTRFKTANGDNLIEFNVAYFNTITDTEARQKALLSYPKEIARAYRKYMNGKLKSKWVFVDSSISLCFQFFENPVPMFLGTIPSTIDYDDAVKTEIERDLEEIRKIIVQKVPHLNDGTLLFEPEEAAVMHQGTVGMVKGNSNVSVLTTYTDVDAIVSKTSSDSVSNNLEKMLNNVYANAGTSVELFASSSNLTLAYSIKNDIALMMILAHKYENFITSILNGLFGNSNIMFKYKILPTSIYTQNEYADELYKFAQQGYSYLLPAVAMGISQKELRNLKELENDVLEISEVLKPLSQETTEEIDVEEKEQGRPEKDPSELNPKTEANQKAIDNNS